jgi:hypothetical protein
MKRVAAWVIAMSRILSYQLDAEVAESLYVERKRGRAICSSGLKDWLFCVS